LLKLWFLWKNMGQVSQQELRSFHSELNKMSVVEVKQLAIFSSKVLIALE
jgi:hypothetical protein